MNARVLPEVLLGRDEPAQAPLPLGAEGVQRWVWQGAYGAMLIEVIDGTIFVNGQAVEPAGSPTAVPTRSSGA